ncbi:MAG: sodium:proline symporter [Parachlamydia sp.]|nr:MAG: sodium:proline symporter [Parachlamydia sp.]
MDFYALAAFFAYFAILLTIGLLAHKRLKSSADFILGNRSLNFWLTALSAHASDMSAWLFMAMPAAILIGGLSQSWIAFGLLIGMFLNWQLVAKKLRQETEKYNSYTLSSYFESRFHDRSGIIRLLTATMALIFLTCYLSAGMIAMGRLFESVFGIDYYIGLTIAMLVVVFYTSFGGFTTIAWVDLFQALFLLVIIILVPILAYMQLPDGLNTVYQAAAAQEIPLGFFQRESIYSYITTLFLILGWGLGYFGMPHILTKFMGIKNPEEINKSKYLGMSWQIIALIGSVAIGFVGIGFFGDPLENSELVFIDMVKVLFHPFSAAFIVCAILAANMSTMDSQILVCGSVLSEDIYKHMFRSYASQKELLLVSRIGVVVISCISLGIAFSNNSSILDAVLYAWSGLGCSFGPLVLVSLYSKHANRNGAIAGIIFGGVTAGIWPLINRHFIEIPIPPMVPGFAASLLSIAFFSYLTRKPALAELSNEKL